jgi:hypothetical protein
LQLLIIQPECGLGNRLCAVVAAQRLADHLQCELRVHWQSRHGCICELADLFDDPCFRAPTPAELQSAHVFEPRLTNQNIAEFLSLAAAHRVVQARAITTFFAPGISWKQSQKEFSDTMQEWSLAPRLRELPMTLPPGTVGVHLRFKDQWHAVRYSPLVLFQRRMEQEIARHPEVVFFVCSDTEWCVQYLSERFGKKRILRYESTQTHRNGPEAIQEALRDIVTLAATERILASPFSTFSSVAAHWGGIPRETLTTKWLRGQRSRPHSFLKLVKWNFREQRWGTRAALEKWPARASRFLLKYMAWTFGKTYQLGFWHRALPSPSKPG